MLFQYTYPQNHSLGHLNDYLIHFVNSIEKTNQNSTFTIEDFFHVDFVDILKDSPKLLLKFQAFFETFKSLPLPSKKKFITILKEVQDFENIFSNTDIDCQFYKTDEVNNLIGDNSFKELADFLFTCVKYDRWNIKGHYELIYNALEYKICPFCGIHPMHKTFREDYDHLAPKSIYPLLSVNPKNLAPMCHDCNSKNKGATDILYLANGSRRIFIYPYTQSIGVTINFDNSIIPQTDLNNPDGKWLIGLNPNDEITANWNKIFKIKRRYVVDFVIPNYETWLRDFVVDCIEENLNLNDENILKYELNRLGKRFKRKWYEQANIIKGPLFEYLGNCNNDLFYNSIKKLYNRLIIPIPE